jgi:hypothetical protein
MIGTNLSLTLTATSPLTVGPTVAVWPISQILTLNSNVTPVDKFGYYQRERCSTADASGLMIAPMTITKAELTAGYIKHAVRFVLPNKKVAPYTFVRPASHYPFDASKLVPGTPQLVKTAAQPAQNSLMPYGSLLRLLPFCASGVTQTNPPTSCITTPSGMSTYDHILYTALQTYGMYLADSVSDSKNAGFSATQDVDPTQFTTLSQMPVNAFEVMVTPSAFNPGSIYNALAVNDPYEFTGSDANGIPIAAWSTTVAAACLRATVSTSTLQTW